MFTPLTKTPDAKIVQGFFTSHGLIESTKRVCLFLSEVLKWCLFHFSNSILFS